MEQAISPKAVRCMGPGYPLGFPQGTRRANVTESLEGTHERSGEMSRVIAAHAVSVDGYITGRDPGPGRGLGDGGELFDWYGSGSTPSQVFDGFRLTEPSARIFDELASRVGASLAGHTTYTDSNDFAD